MRLLLHNYQTAMRLLLIHHRHSHRRLPATIANREGTKKRAFLDKEKLSSERSLCRRVKKKNEHREDIVETVGESNCMLRAIGYEATVG